MSFVNYLGLLLVSISWIWRLYIYRPPGQLWLFFLLAGLVLLCPGVKNRGLFNGSEVPGRREDLPEEGELPDRKSRSAGKPPGWYAVVLIPLILIFFVFPGQFITGPVILMVGLIAGVLVGEGGRMFRPVEGAVLAGTVLTIQAFLLPLLAVLTAHIHQMPLGAYLLYPVVSLFEPAAAVSGGKIFVSSAEEIFGYTVSPEKLGFLPVTLYFASVVIFRFFRGDAIRTLPRVLAAFLIYSVVRFIAIFFASVLSNSARLFWEPWVFLISLIPLALLMAWAVPLENRHAITESPKKGSAVSYPAVALILTVSFFLLAGSVLFHDPGRMKEGRVLFDENYSDWEWTTLEYDRDWYGTKSGYNYYCLAEYIDHFYHLERGTRPFTPDYLSRYDVVVLKTPTRDFERGAIEALVDYVDEGGGLFLIGDHTNVFGTSARLNTLATRFGLRFDYNSVYQLDSGSLSYYQPPLIGAHPSVLHLNEFLFATSCTMQSPLLAENVIISNAVKGVYLDYSRKGYFPDRDVKEYDFGFLNLMSGVKYGRGRVLGFTDSTVFSNFFMFIPGKPELFISSLDWLNRANRWNSLNIMFFLMGLAGVIWGGIRLRKCYRFSSAALVMFSLLLGSAVSIQLFESLKRAAYPFPELRKEMKSIAFDRDPSTFEMPTRNLVRRKEASLHTFYVWTQRMGFVPTLCDNLEESLSSADIAVVANPRRRLTVDEMGAVVDFCSKGGNLLLLIDQGSRMGGGDDLLGIFRMSRTRMKPDTTEIWNLRGERICPAFNPGGLRGGIPMLTVPDGNVVMACERLGKGRFFAFNDFLLFSQASMGPTSNIPSLRTRRIYHLEFQILEILRGKREPNDIQPYPEDSNRGGDG